MCLTHIVLPCNPDETGRPLPPDERLQCLADGEHSIAHHIYPIKVILTYLSHKFCLQFGNSSLVYSSALPQPRELPDRCCILIWVVWSDQVPTGVLRSHSFRSFSASLSHHFSLRSIPPPKGWILSQILILIYFYIDSGVHTCGIDFHFDNSKAGHEERPQQLARVPTYQVCLCAQHN